MGEISEDMISGLPEDLLLSILMRVPIKDAIATMILCKRWRFIWTMMPVLEYYKESDDDESKKSVWWLLDKSMQLHKAPILGVLLMKLGPQCPSNANIGKWIAKAIDHGLVVLDFDLRWSVVDPTSLPKTLYLCESLEILKLSHKILVDVPSTTTARLPSLTMLYLDNVVYKNEDSLNNLLASCPILERLMVVRKNDDNVRKFSVKSPCLMDLWYESSDNVEEEDTGRCLVIDAPALTEFYFFDRSGETCLIENPSCFEKVSIMSLVGWSFLDANNLLKSFSKVSSLRLDLSDEMVVCIRTIKFPRLIDCTIYPCDIDWMDSLVSLLQNAPKLKKLTVNYEFTVCPPIASMSWSESSYDPVCLSSSVEKFELVDYEGRVEEEELVEYILTNAKCLKTATISMKSTLTFEDKDTMMEELRAIPMVSKTSKLMFKTDVLNL